MICNMKATLERIDELTRVATVLWSQHDLKDIQDVLTKYINGAETEVFAHLEGDQVVGLALVSLRHDYVEGCTSSPVGYLEAICVPPEFRHVGIASKLCKECEAWAKEQGCSEFASDCDLNNEASHAFHLSVGFKETSRIIHFKKEL